MEEERQYGGADRPRLGQQINFHQANISSRPARFHLRVGGKTPFPPGGRGPIPPSPPPQGCIIGEAVRQSPSSLFLGG